MVVDRQRRIESTRIYLSTMWGYHRVLSPLATMFKTSVTHTLSTTNCNEEEGFGSSEEGSGSPLEPSSSTSTEPLGHGDCGDKTSAYPNRNGEDGVTLPTDDEDFDRAIKALLDAGLITQPPALSHQLDTAVTGHRGVTPSAPIAGGVVTNYRGYMSADETPSSGRPG